MVELWGNILSIIASVLAVCTETVLFDAFFQRKVSGKVYWHRQGLCIILSLLLLCVNQYGYTLKIILEISSCYLLCYLLYEGRLDRRLFIVVTVYAVLYSYSYWFDYICCFCLNITYQEYVWNISLYSISFLGRTIFIFLISLVIRKIHNPLAQETQNRVWIPLSVTFPISTLLVLWYVYTYSAGQLAWQICLLILDIVDIVAIILLDYAEQNAFDREKLVAANERARVQDENIQALSKAYADQRKLTHDFHMYLATLSDFMDREAWEDAREFVSELKHKENERVLMVNSHNATVDAILNQKGYIGQQRGIDMRFRVNDLAPLKISKIDLAIVLGNLIDNAIEACMNLPKQNQWVSVMVLYNQDSLSITVINPSVPVSIKNGHIATSKEDPLLHGFGLENVKEILNRHQAEYIFSYDSGRFIFSIDWPCGC